MSSSKSFKIPTAVHLSLGASGPDVRELQDFLEHFGYLRSTQSDHPYEFLQDSTPLPTATPDRFDEATLTALHHYQQFQGLPLSDQLDEATIGQMSLPRCGVPDAPVGEFVAQGNKWSKTDLTYGFQEFTSDLTPAQIRGAIASAFQLWSRVTPLTFREVSLGSNPDIIVRFTTGDHNDDFPFDGVGNVLAHAFFPPPNGGNLAGDTHFDDAETWSVTLPTSGRDLATVAAHEFGHALGLSHSQVQGALMAPTYRGPQRFLSQDDINGIQSLYGDANNNRFADITDDIYRSEILAAVDLNFIAGFNNNTFQPLALLTREQLVSMSLEALKNIPDLNLQLPSQVGTSPFPDVNASRWSAAKISFASVNQIVAGYRDGTFRPTVTVTRAEMMAILRRTAEFVRSRQGFNPQVPTTQTPFAFNDIRNHWAEAVIEQMSGYCGVASPLNERGRAFFPTRPARRNYGAAATLRMLNCVRAV